VPFRGGRLPSAPPPVALNKKEGTNSYHLAATGPFQLNLVLLHVLRELFRINLEQEELLAQFAGDLSRTRSST
jgi:hypothetical protein